MARDKVHRGKVTLTSKPTVEIIVPFFNEMGGVEQMHARIRGVVDPLPYEFRFLYVDDGSTDGTGEALGTLAQADGRVTPILLSRNFGHQAALSAGLQKSSADGVITMDGDGQHPPELIPQMLTLMFQGYDVVQTQRVEPAQRGFLQELDLRHLLPPHQPDQRHADPAGRRGFPRAFAPGRGGAQVHARIPPFPARHGGLDRLSHRHPARTSRASA